MNAETGNTDSGIDYKPEAGADAAIDRELSEVQDDPDSGSSKKDSGIDITIDGQLPEVQGDPDSDVDCEPEAGADVAIDGQLSEVQDNSQGRDSVHNFESIVDKEDNPMPDNHNREYTISCLLIFILVIVLPLYRKSFCS